MEVSAQQTNTRSTSSCIVIALIVILSATSQSQTPTITAEGFVTSKAGDSIQLGSVEVRGYRRASCFLQLAAINDRRRELPCSELAISIGEKLRVSGSKISKTSLKASQVIAWPSQSVAALDDPESGGPAQGPFTGGAFLEEPPETVGRANKLPVQIWVNGIPLRASSATTVNLASDGLRRENVIGGRNIYGGSITFWNKSKAIAAQPSTSVLVPGNYISYAGKGDSGVGSQAMLLDVFANNLTARESDFIKRQSAHVTEPDYVSGSPGSIEYSDGERIQIVPDKNVQEYVSKVGWALIPASQGNQSANDSGKIDFRFYVVRPFKNTRENRFIEINGQLREACFSVGLWGPLAASKPNSLVSGVVGEDNGLILIPDAALVRLNSEGQLAFLLSASIETITQKSAYFNWVQMKSNQGVVDPCRDAISLNKRIIRMGIRNEYVAGYDIREAPLAWAAEKGIAIANPSLSTGHTARQFHDDIGFLRNKTAYEFPWYAAYAFFYVGKYFADVDYSKLKRGEAEYAQFRDELRKADPDAFAKQK